MKEFIQDYIEKLVQEQESLIAKYIAETGLKPSEICLVERGTDTGRVFYPDLKSKYDSEPVMGEG